MSESAGASTSSDIVTQAITKQSIEPIVKSGGGNGAISFDEMDVLESAIPTVKEAKEMLKDKKINPRKHMKGELSFGDEPEDQQMKNVDSQEEKDAKASKAEKVSKKEAKGVSDAKTDEAKAAAKAYRIKQGESEFDLFADTPISVKVAGKDEQVPFQELLNQYSGKVDYNRKYSELDRERKTFHTERQGLVEGINRIHKIAVDEGNPRLAIESIAEVLGADPDKIWTDMLKQVESQVDEFSRLSPEERKARKAETELDYYKNKERIQGQFKAREAELKQVDSVVNAIQETHKISRDEFFNAYKDLEAAHKQGTLKSELNPELVRDYILELRNHDKVNETIKDIGEVPNAQFYQRELLRLARENPEFTASDLREIIDQVLPKKSSASKNKTLGDRATERQREGKDPGALRPLNEPMFFDSL